MLPNSHKYLILVRSTGIALLAARPGETSAGRFSWLILLSETRTLRSQQLASRQVPPTLNSCRYFGITKKETPFGISFFVVRSTGIEPAWSYPQDP